MSYSHLRPEDFMRALENDESLTQIVQRLLPLDERRSSELKRFVDRTTTSAYRRVHGPLAIILDEAIRELDSIQRSGGQQDIERIKSKLLLDLSRVLILVKYQGARDQLSKGIENTLTVIIDRLINDIRRVQVSDIEKTMKVFERARVLIDALAVLTYELKR